jgi:hypothetical protein
LFKKKQLKKNYLHVLEDCCCATELRGGWEGAQGREQGRSHLLHKASQEEERKDREMAIAKPSL